MQAHTLCPASRCQTSHSPPRVLCQKAVNTACVEAVRGLATRLHLNRDYSSATSHDGGCRDGYAEV
jgi:hypothetical protein